MIKTEAIGDCVIVDSCHCYFRREVGRDDKKDNKLANESNYTSAAANHKYSADNN
jgi:hypothetical protein